MLAKIGARDRLVMAGLVILGLLTVTAGVLTGRSTVAYLLAKDARDTASTFAARIDYHLSAQDRLNMQDVAGAEYLGQTVRVLDATALDEQFSRDQVSPATPKSDRDWGLLSGLDRLFMGWAMSGEEKPADEHVGTVNGFAVLAPDKAPLAIGGGLGLASVDALLGNPDIAAALNDALAEQTITLAKNPGGAQTTRIAFVPMISDGKVERVYALRIDQAGATSLTSTALTVVTLTTSFLIVMGFSVPAVIASRRIRERWLAEDQIRFLALHDSLTGLPNRLQFRQHLERAVVRAKRHDNLLGVLFLDLDRFKDVNDTLGHPTGDALLEEVAARLREQVREADLIGRLGGDEFAVIAEDLESPDDAARVARRICSALGEVYHVNGHEVMTSASIGIALGPDDSQSAETMLKDADLALYRAKQDGRNTFRFFEPAMDAVLQRRRRLENDLRKALRKKTELYIDYQPQFDLESGKLIGYEALVRWHHPTEGEITPSNFLPIAEETGLIGPLGEWIMRTACAYATTWPDDTTLAVNISPAQFKTQDVVALVRTALDETGLDPHRLELEITEKALLHNTDSVMETLEQLDQLGISIAMDDFGTGYSSLSYLTRFPVRKIKIDRSFIETLGSNPQTSAIVSSIVGLGQSLNVTITAEGVETQGQADM